MRQRLPALVELVAPTTERLEAAVRTIPGTPWSSVGTIRITWAGLSD